MTVAPPAPPAGTAADPTPRPDLDAAISTLRERASAWLELPLERKIELARSALDGSFAVAERQVAAAATAKGHDPDGPLAGEDWLAGPYIQIRTLRLLIATLERIRRYGEVRIPHSLVRERRNGQLAVRVFPGDALDGLLYRGFAADVWMEPGIGPEELAEHVGLAHRQPGRPGVALVLGAGNVASIPTLDLVYKLFAEGRVVILKFNPVNDYLGPFVEEAFAELIDAGFLRLAYGGADIGSYLCFHDDVDEVHITGSEKSHDAIVFGPGDEGAERKRQNQPLLRKPITSELGNVSPVIVVPGDWSPADLDFQAENLATQMAQNAGFNCNAAKVIVTHRDWPQRRELLQRLRRVLLRLPPRPAYYPGAEERHRRFAAAYPQSETLGVRRPGVVPPTLALDVDPRDREQLAFREESFCAFTVETALTGDDTADFLASAVDFCNHSLHGTLNAGILIHPRSESRFESALEDAVERLRYGSVGINHWAAMAYALGSTPWGAFPGHPLDDIQSGRGVVHNTWLFERPQKTVVRGPFRVAPKPAWFVGHQSAHRVARELAGLEADRSLLRLPAILWHAVRG